MNRIFVTGAGGLVSGLVAEELLRRGLDFAAGSSRPSQPAALAQAGVETVPFDQRDPATMARALTGVERLFLVTPLAEDMVRMAAEALEAASRASVSHVVRLSVMNADQDSPHLALRQHGEIDALTAGSGMGYTILESCAFMQDFATRYAYQIRNGRIELPAGTAKIAFIDARDVAACAAEALASPETCDGRAPTLTGQVAKGLADVARIVSAAVEHDVVYAPLSDDEAGSLLREKGLDPWTIRAVLSCWAAFRDGLGQEVSMDAAELMGRPQIRFVQCAADIRSAWE